jgi:nitrate reductase alpha subunit
MKTISVKLLLVLAHTLATYNEDQLAMEVKVPVKGSLKNNGIESFFTSVISTKKVPLKKLEGYGSDMLHITDEEEMLGFKYCFQTKLTKETVNERMRSPMGMFTTAETFTDNDIQVVLDHLHNYYK